MRKGVNLQWYTPLKISIRTADEISTKLPVTDLEQAPLRGAVSNLHRYKSTSRNKIEILHDFDFTHRVLEILMCF